MKSADMPTDPIERLRQIGRNYIEFGVRFPNHYIFIFMTPHPAHEPDEQDREIMGNPEVDAYALLKWAVQEAINSGRLRDELKDAEMISQTLWASVHGVISLDIAKCKDPWVEWRPLRERAEMMLDVTMRGILKDPSSLSAKDAGNETSGKSPLPATDAGDGTPDAVNGEEK